MATIPTGWKTTDAHSLMLECVRCGDLASGSYIATHKCLASPQTAVLPAPLPEREQTGAYPSELAAMTDDQLRAECERRRVRIDPAMAEVHQGILNAMAPYLSMDDEGAVEIVPYVAKALRDRDAWKRRAEAAEAKLAPEWTHVCGYSGRPETRARGWDCAQCGASPPGGVSLESRLAIARGLEAWLPDDKVAPIVYGTDRTPERVHERGPGIAATKPDNSAYFDERDLLADDA